MHSLYDLIICGAGPIGLALAAFMGRRGFRVLVIEKRSQALETSRAIGITPPSLAILSELGLAPELCSAGHRIEQVVVHGGKGAGDILGTTDFTGIGGSWPFILSLPQVQTEAILAKCVEDISTVKIQRGAELIGLYHLPDTVEVEYRFNEEVCQARGHYLAGCDGADSTVRRLAGIPWKGKRYKPSFVMGDLIDRQVYRGADSPVGIEGFGGIAHLFFTPGGAVESFPLPGGKRRWIVQTKGFIANPAPDLIVGLVKDRTGISLEPADLTWQSPFGTQRFAAGTWAQKRVLLVGDAAHTMSPIGGQGMNTGFADVADLVPALSEALARPDLDSGHNFHRWESIRRRAWALAARRAALSMGLGVVTGTLSGARNLVLAWMLKGPFKSRLPKDYAMLTIGPRYHRPRTRKGQVFIHRIATQVPDHVLSQGDALTFMKRIQGDDAEKIAFLDRIYEHSAIDRRHTVIADYGKTPDQFTFFPATEKLQPSPGTEARNKVFVREADRLALAAVDRLLASGLTVGPADISHIITVSCTGFSAPGFEQTIQKHFAMLPRVQRTHIGFMGCYAAFPALRTAQAICKADPKARVLIVSVELCSLHFQTDWETDSVVANALFADGAAAALVSADPGDSVAPWYRLGEFSTTLIDKSAQRMAWEAGDTGYRMRLSAYVPKIIEANLPAVLDDLLARANLERSAIKAWAIHPGGRAILDRVRTSMEIEARRLSPSYEVLRRYGNMSSATMFFVLADTLTEGSTFATAFGPGLTVEAAVLERLPGRGSADVPAYTGRKQSSLRMELRSQERERMDDPGASLSALKRTIGQFALLNRLFSASRRLVRRHLFPAMTDMNREYHLVDIGAGGGDLARWMVSEARRRGIRLRVTCLEPDLRIVPWLVEGCLKWPEISVLAKSSAALGEIGPFDFAFSNHVLHHLEEATLEELLQSLESHCRINYVLNDLRRSFWAHLGYNIAVRFVAPFSMARHDGTMSIRRGFSTEELEMLILRAGLGQKVCVRRAPPARIYLTREQGSE